MADDIAENASGSAELAQPLELVRGNVERALGLVRAFRSSILEQDAEAPDTVDVTREIEATLAQLARDRGADAARRAGDDAHLVLKLHGCLLG